MTLTTDPWVFEYGPAPAGEYDPWEFDNSPERHEVEARDRAIEEKFRPSLVARARKRKVRIYGGEGAENGWVVEGDPKLGDGYPSYHVILGSDRKYICGCYSTDHGETRARAICSHVLAVILYRNSQGGDRNGPGVESTPETESLAIVEQFEDSKPSSSIAPSEILPQPLTDTCSPDMTGTPDRDDPRFGVPPLPDFITDIRPHQWQAVQEIVAGFDEGADVMFVDAPTGSGKTLIAELVRRVMKQRAAYICSSLTLQDQFVNDYPYAKVLKGRSNYPTLGYPFPEYTAADCTKTGPGTPCLWCADVHRCHYEVAKAQALASPIAVVNTAYALTEWNYIGRMSGRPLVIVDECDVLERELMGFVEFSVGGRRLNDLGILSPKKGVHKKTIATWMSDELIPVIKERISTLPTRTDDVRVIRERSGLVRLRDQAELIVDELVGDEDRDNWVRDYSDDKTSKEEGLVLKPTRVNHYGDETMWSHGEKWLGMSATIISAQEMSDSLGIEESGRTFGVVRVPMTFDVERRRIHVAPVASMSAKDKAESYPVMARGIQKVMDRHPHERILVHTVSYDLANYLHRELRSPRCLTYKGARERARVLSEFRSQQGGVLLAPSFDRGVDLKDDDCRVVVVAKIPFPYLGDKQVSARMRLEGGQQWYTVQTIRTLVQMTGRHVRSRDDWGVTYILDAQFNRKIWKDAKHLLPGWWVQALNRNFPTRELM